MTILNTIRKRVAGLISPVQNAMNIGNQFLRYGNKRVMQSEWSQVSMNDKDFYTGYGYAAIKKNANKVARLATENVRTLSEKEGFEHPYIPLITDSKYFSEHQFWRDISTYIDLKGVYYLFALRARSGERSGSILYFKLLNPYNIQRVINQDTLEVGGYIETRNGLQRELNASMIIPIYELNPFDDEIPFSMADASRESQFTIKTGGEYTRNSLQHNINAPGILSTDVVLGDEDFKSFAYRARGHEKGEPLFANGKGAITWQSMNVDMSKAALTDIHHMSRESLFAVAGVSKTIMGIEESGTTRETANVQKDLNTEDTVIPRIQLIIDALSLDYINHYPQEFESTRAYIVVNNPLETDHDSDIKETQVKSDQFELYKSLINAGVTADIAAKYIAGEVDIEALGEITPQEPIDEEDEEETEENSINKNQFISEGIIHQQQGALKNAIVNAEEQLVMSVLKNVQSKVNNKYDVVSEIISASAKKNAEQEILGVLTNFYGVVFNVEGKSRMRENQKNIGMNGSFSIGSSVSNDIRDLARKVSSSHVDTVLDDLLVTVREAALEGASMTEIISKIKNKWSKDISETRATTIARTETNRAFTRAQYEADKQFVEQNGIEGRAFKRWRTRSGNPCNFCQTLAAEGEVPFSNDFRSLGDTVKADGKSLSVNFESLEAGNAHPNCSCDYELIISKSTFTDVTMNSFEKNFIEENGVQFVQQDNGPGLPAAKYSHKTNLITVYDDSTLDHTVYHELGHAINFKGDYDATKAIKKDSLSVIIERIANTQGVTKAQAREAYRISIESGKPSKFLEYISNPTEIFAEGYAQYRENKAKFKRNAPALYEMFKNL